MSFAGTLLGFLASLPLSILSTRHLFANWVSSFARFIAAGIRTIPVLLWAIVFVILVGLGPLAGTFGIAAYTLGYLAKIYADLFEGTDPEIIEAVQSTGASKLQLVRFVILPEAANAVLAQVLFMLEYNIRASSVLGFVGAGGLGFVIQIYLQSLDYKRLATILLLVLVIVLIMDGVSAWLRKRFLLSAQPS
jgi:phosphonate transport system permease protein